MTPADRLDGSAGLGWVCVDVAYAADRFDETGAATIGIDPVRRLIIGDEAVGRLAIGDEAVRRFTVGPPCPTGAGGAGVDRATGESVRSARAVGEEFQASRGTLGPDGSTSSPGSSSVERCTGDGPASAVGGDPRPSGRAGTTRAISV